MGIIAARQQREGNGNLTFYDQDTGEILSSAGAPVTFEDEFLGPQLSVDTTKWTAFDVSAIGDTTPFVRTNVANGVLRCPLDAQDEAQESGIYWNDQRSLVLNQGLVIQFVLSLGVLPTLLSEAVWGLAGDTNSVSNNVAEAVWFKADGSGIVVVESDDTVNEEDDVATGIVMTAGTPLIFTIDCTTINDCKFWIGEDQVATGTTFDMSTVSALALQPYVHLSKSGGAGLGTIDVDMVRVAQQRGSV